MQCLFSSALQTELLALHNLMTSANEDLLQVAREHQRRIEGHCFLICGEQVNIQRRYRKETGALLTIQDNSEDTLRTVRKKAHLDPHLTVEDLAGVVLLGSLRIDSPWLSGFEPARPKPFKRLDGSVCEVPMMRQHTEVEIYQNRKTTAVRKQLQDSTQVEFMMGPVPDREISYRPQNLRLQLPRFSIDQIHDRRLEILVRQRIRVDFEEEGGETTLQKDCDDHWCDCEPPKDLKVVFDSTFYFRISRSGLVIAEGCYDGL